MASWLRPIDRARRVRPRLGALVALALVLGTWARPASALPEQAARSCCCPAGHTTPDAPAEGARLLRSTRCAWSRCCAAPPRAPAPAAVAALSQPAPEAALAAPLAIDVAGPAHVTSLAPPRPRAAAPPGRAALAILLLKQSFLI